MGDYLTIGSVLTVVVGLLTYLAKMQFKGILDGIKNNNAVVKGVEKTLNGKIDSLEKKIYEEIEKNCDDICEVKNELNQLKADLPFVYTLREDFIRTLNNVDNKMGTIENKIDKLLQK